MSDYIIRADAVHKHYSMGATDLPVLKGISLAVKTGEFLAIVGESGSGKSTFLHILGALDRADQGTVEFEGSDLTKWGSRKLNTYRNSMVGFIFQFYHLLDELTVLENVMLPAMISSSIVGWIAKRKNARQRASELVDMVGLSHRLGHKPYQLSGGERQRVAIGRALMNQPRLLLADEPTGNLDSAAGNGILEIFERLNRGGQSIIMVTHDQKIAQRADRIIRIHDGVITDNSSKLC